MREILKYPRTQHLSGSTLQKGDMPGQMSMRDLKKLGGEFVFEEKADGGNGGISFSPDDGALVLQSRGHALMGGARERQFDMFKAWAQTFEAEFRDALSDRFVCYGEVVTAKHSQYYDNIPHVFLGFDVYDRRTQTFLSTPARNELLAKTPVVPVHVCHTGWVDDRDLPKLVGKSVYKTPAWREALKEASAETGQEFEAVLKETDDTDLSEGLYLKHEQDGITIGRYKFVRAGFLQAIAASETHWAQRPLIQNRLAVGVDIFAYPAATPARGGP